MLAISNFTELDSMNCIHSLIIPLKQTNMFIAHYKIYEHYNTFQLYFTSQICITKQIKLFFLHLNCNYTYITCSLHYTYFENNIHKVILNRVITLLGTYH